MMNAAKRKRRIFIELKPNTGIASFTLRIIIELLVFFSILNTYESILYRNMSSYEWIMRNSFSIAGPYSSEDSWSEENKK